MEESPLHAFELHDLIPLVPAGVDISINKAVILMGGGRAGGLSHDLCRRRAQVSARQVAEHGRIDRRVHSGIILDTMGEAGMKYFPLIATLFLFILFANLLGLIPGSYRHEPDHRHRGICGGDLQVESGSGIFAPWNEIPPAFLCRLEHRLVAAAMIPIELISQLARPISLAVRLFANMTAGHVILGVLFGLAISGGLLIGWLPFAFTIAMNGLEVGIAFIQAYIFTVLSCVYLGMP